MLTTCAFDRSITSDSSFPDAIARLKAFGGDSSLPGGGGGPPRSNLGESSPERPHLIIPRRNDDKNLGRWFLLGEVCEYSSPGEGGGYSSTGRSFAVGRIRGGGGPGTEGEVPIRNANKCHKKQMESECDPDSDQKNERKRPRKTFAPKSFQLYLASDDITECRQSENGLLTEQISGATKGMFLRVLNNNKSNFIVNLL